MKDSPLIVALDTSSLEAAAKLMKQLEGVVTYFKIGFELFTAHGWESVKLVRKAGARIFLDLKLHDIPTTVAKTAAVICEHEIDLFNVHATGGLEMMKRVRETVDAHTGKKKPQVIAVTVLTSHSAESLSAELGVGQKLDDYVLHLAGLAQKAGLDGVVSSPQEIQLIRRKLSAPFLIVTPGIRGAQDAKGDQKRTYSAPEAVSLGADYIVVGRPITQAPDPAREARQILASLGA